LICTEPIVHAHLGVNSCRACAVFYRRARNVPRKKLKCKSGTRDCIEQNPRTTCRACRHARFQEVLAKAGQAAKQVDESDEQEVSSPESVHLPESVDTATPAVDSTIQSKEKEEKEEEEEEEQKATTSQPQFLNHETFFTFCESSKSDTPLLDMIKRGYSLMCLIRKSGELGTYIANPGDVIIRKGIMDYTPGNYSNQMPNNRIFAGAMTEFANFAFADFRKLDDESKKFFIEKGRYVMAPIDVTYRITKNFPGDNVIRLPGYTTYVRMTELEKFFDNCPDDVDKEGIIAAVRKTIARGHEVNRRNYVRISPTDTEFVALLGLALWNDEITIFNDKLLKIATRNRRAIMKELHVYYTKKGKRDYAERLGNIFCLLVNYQNNSMKNREDFQLCKLMNLFKGFHEREKSRANSEEADKDK
ncbi:hypothetical protein PFISCL1PPCAC_9597, partial [Pristionchus fissidentatus]